MRLQPIRLFFLGFATLLFITLILFIISQPSPYPATALQPTLAPANLHISATQDSFVIYIIGGANLSGLQLHFTDGDNTHVIPVTEDFSQYLSLSDNIVPHGTCIAYQTDDNGTQSTLPRYCFNASYILREFVPTADQFWYDTELDTRRAFAVYRHTTLLATCPTTGTFCDVFFDGTGESPPEITPISLLYPTHQGQHEHFTIRIDNFQVLSLDISSMNFRWNVAGGEFRFDLVNLEDSRPIVENLASGDCIQLYLLSPELNVPDCEQIFPHPFLPSDVFWTTRLASFEVYQANTLLATCSTLDTSECAIEWPGVVELMTIIPPPSGYVPVPQNADFPLFYIRSAAISQIEWNTFVETGRYFNDDWWSFEGRLWRDEQADDPHLYDNPDDSPAWVAWYEAGAFCRWEGGRLPTEDEWLTAYGKGIFPEESLTTAEWTATSSGDYSPRRAYVILQPKDGEIVQTSAPPDNPFPAAGFRCVVDG